MEFIVNVDGIDYKAKNDNIAQLIDEIVFFYSLPRDGSYNSQIICDSKEMLEYIMNQIKKNIPSFILYDLSQNKTNSLLELSSLLREKFLIVYGFEEYIEFLKENYYKGMVTICGREYSEAQKRMYQAIELGRDNLFAAFNTKSIFVFSNDEYDSFVNFAVNFTSFYHNFFDFNNLLINEVDNTSLSDYFNYIKKGLKIIPKK